MYQNNNSRYSSTCARLNAEIQDLTVRIKVADTNQQLLNSYNDKITRLNENIAYCNMALDRCKPLLADSQDYVVKRRKQSMQRINRALQMAGEIIQDSTEGIYFQMDGDEAWLSTPDGLEVDMVEGGGYRQISSTFIRSVIANTTDDTLNTLMLDEVFALVSPENSAVLSLYLNVICQDMQVISIEQKPQVYSNIDCVAYKFNKIGKFSEFTKSEIKHSEAES